MRFHTNQMRCQQCNNAKTFTFNCSHTFCFECIARIENAACPLCGECLRSEVHNVIAIRPLAAPIIVEEAMILLLNNVQRRINIGWLSEKDVNDLTYFAIEYAPEMLSHLSISSAQLEAALNKTLLEPQLVPFEMVSEDFYFDYARNHFQMFSWTPQLNRLPQRIRIKLLLIMLELDVKIPADDIRCDDLQPDEDVQRAIEVGIKFDAHYIRLCENDATALQQWLPLALCNPPILRADVLPKRYRFAREFVRQPNDFGEFVDERYPLEFARLTGQASKCYGYAWNNAMLTLQRLLPLIDTTKNLAPYFRFLTKDAAIMLIERNYDGLTWLDKFCEWIRRDSREFPEFASMFSESQFQRLVDAALEHDSLDDDCIRIICRRWCDDGHAELMMQLVEKSPLALSFVDPAQRWARKITLHAIECHPCAIEYAIALNENEYAARALGLIMRYPHELHRISKIHCGAMYANIARIAIRSDPQQCEIIRIS